MISIHYISTIDDDKIISVSTEVEWYAFGYDIFLVLERHFKVCEVMLWDN